MNVPLIREFKLGGRNGDGRHAYVNEEGAFIGPDVPLLEQDRWGRFKPRMKDDLERLFKIGYGSPFDLTSRMTRLSYVAQALNKGEVGLASISLVLMELQPLPSGFRAQAMAEADSLAKYNPNWREQPRLPAGNPSGGRWTSEDEGGISSNSIYPEAEPFTDRTHLYSSEAVAAVRLVEYSSQEAPAPAPSDLPRPTKEGTPTIEVDEDGQVHLPPGDRNDELGDLLEWIANAKPEDERAIRSEIKRLYYEAGDFTDGNTLNGALSVIIHSGATLEDRKRILELYDNLTKRNPSSFRQFDTIAGLSIGIGSIEKPPLYERPPRSAMWGKPWPERGREAEELYGGTPEYRNFKTIDDFDDGVALSIKTIDLDAPLYQDAKRLTYRINSYVRKLADFDGGSQNGITIEPGETTSRILRIVVPENSESIEQSRSIESAIDLARKLNVRIEVIRHR